MTFRFPPVYVSITALTCSYRFLHLLSLNSQSNLPFPNPDPTPNFLFLIPSSPPTPCPLPSSLTPSLISVVDLIYWKDIKKSAAVAASSLLLLIALSFLSVLTVVSYISLTGTACLLHLPHRYSFFPLNARKPEIKSHSYIRSRKPGDFTINHYYHLSMQ